VFHRSRSKRRGFERYRVFGNMTEYESWLSGSRRPGS
jgi:hypothetical protein